MPEQDKEGQEDWQEPGLTAQERERRRTGRQRGWPDDETRGEVLGKPSGSVGLAAEDNQAKAEEGAAEAAAQASAEPAEPASAFASATTVERLCPACGNRGPHAVVGDGSGPGLVRLRCGSCNDERDGRLSSEERG